MSTDNKDSGNPPEGSPLTQINLQFGPLFKWAGVILSLLLIFLFLSFVRSIYTDILWYEGLGYKSVLLKILTTRLWLFLIGTCLFAILMGSSLFSILRTNRGNYKLEVSSDVNLLLRRLVFWGSVASTILLAVIFGSIISNHWEIFLKFFNSVSFGTLDPIYHKDISFYVFSMPVLHFVQGWLLGLAIVILLTTFLLHFINCNLRGIPINFGTATTIQLSLIGSIVMALFAWGHWLDRWGLLLSEHGAVFGAAYTDIHARQPALTALVIIAIITGLIILANIYFRNIRLLVGGVILWVAVSVLGGNIVPISVQQFSVNPNEFAKESPFIQNAITFTRSAYALDSIKEDFFPTDEVLTQEVISENLQTINNIRLWDPRPLSDVYRQIQLIRPYYDFKEADVDRYMIDGRKRQVLLSTREVAPEKLEQESQTWVNTKLFYTHGIGISMSPVTDFTPEGRPMFFAKDIPIDGVIPIQSYDSTGEPEILVSNPRIYYGENTKDYVLVNTNTDELDFQTGEGTLVRTKYAGSGGVQLNSIIKRIAYAWQFADINILISGELTGESLIQYHRHVQDRIRKLVPFLVLDSDPYVVATNDVLYWMQDLYTTSDQYPYSEPYDSNVATNYIRNSVKATLDAYEGSIRFYIWDDKDPVIRTYSKMFPGVFLPKEDMPEDLQTHVRYPQDLFSIQAEKNMKFHMKDVQNFYNNEDLWATPNEKFGQSDTVQPVEPYYAIMKLPGETEEEFVLLFPYTPNQRQNLIGWLAARSDGENYGKLVAFNFPKDRQIDGPEQVEARIDNDQDISAWFTLRCTEAAACIRGNLLVIPVGDSLLYAEPVYIQAEGVRFPELKRVILATGEKVVMEDSLEKALKTLTGYQEIADSEAPGKVKVGSQDDSVIRNEFESIKDSINQLKGTLTILEKALERLGELTGEGE